MKIEQENINMFLEVVGDRNPIHKNISDSNELARLTGKEAKDRTIVPGLYLASKIARIFSPYNSFEFRFKDFIYPDDELELVKEFSYDSVKISFSENGNTKLEGIARHNPEKELGLADCFSCERIVRGKDVYNFNKCLNDNKTTNGNVPAELLGSLISGALWSYLERNKKDEYGLYTRQSWNFYRPVAVNQPVTVRIEQKRNKKNLYIFSTSVEAERRVAVGGEAGCILVPR